MDAIEVLPIETERLVLRQLVEEDIPFIYELFKREETNRYVEYDCLKTLVEARKLFALYISPKPNLFRLGIVLKNDQQMVGTVGLYEIYKEHGTSVLGYDLLFEYWNRGIMTEAVNALVDYAFRELNLNRIEGSADPENIASLRVLEKCGFEKEGLLREKFYYGGAFHDDMVYSILGSDYGSLGQEKLKTEQPL